MLALLDLPNVDTVVSDQCEYHLYTTGPNGERMLAKKPTKWASTSPQMLHRLRRRCRGDHTHQRLEGGRAAAAAFYPDDLILEILRGVKDTCECENPDHDDVADRVVAGVAQSNSGVSGPGFEPTIEQRVRKEGIATPEALNLSKVRFADGRTVDLQWSFRDSYKDEPTSPKYPGSRDSSCHCGSTGLL